MGAQDNRYRTVGDITEIESKRQELQKYLDAAVSIDYRRKLGQFSTPIALAREVVACGLQAFGDDEITFFDPAFGTGAFCSALFQEAGQTGHRIRSVDGIEIDDHIYSKSKILWEPLVSLCNADFTTKDNYRKFNFLVCNPPYVRHHLIDKDMKQRLAKMIYDEFSLPVSGLMGLYCYFVLLAHRWLEPGAVCAWLIPSEFMDVNYGNALKEYLLNHVHLLRVHRYDPDGCQFKDAIVSSCVVLFKNEVVKNDYDVKFTFGGTLSDPAQVKMINSHTLATKGKWAQIAADTPARGDFEESIVGDFFFVKRGIATGDNKFFILTREQINKLGIDMCFFRPILPSPRHLKENEVRCDSKGYPAMERQLFLLDCLLPESEIKSNHPSLWAYLETGLETTAKKYLCRTRKMWYLQEHRDTAPILCSYMGRGSKTTAPFRFILNHSNAVASNSYLMLYPKPDLAKVLSKDSQMISIVWEILCSISAKAMECEGRVYGGGLRKIEPKELLNVPCPNLEKILAQNRILLFK